ncbi:MAG TPA: phosphate-starvation-inducible PsiE family protein, partial [Xanthobacteraceae bacterium]|nr:phosphate-starvation-inducible PsiE family protein [Xanthobacteraceae bacterium]
TGGRLGDIATAQDFQDILQNAFGGILVVFVGLELLETMRAYFADHHVRVEVIIFVAIIATGRHIIGLDVHHTEPMTFIGLSTLMLALSGSYFLMKKAGKETN